MPKIDTPHKQFGKYIDRWVRCRDCFSGSDAVKAKGPMYLPPLGSHEHNVGGFSSRSYEHYKQRALFYNATGRTVEGLSGFVFQKDPTLETHSELTEHHAEDITFTGVDLSTFALWVVQEILITGRFGLLVDANPEAEGAMIRPYWNGYQAEQIISWREQRIDNDPAVLTRVVLQESVEEVNPKDDFDVSEAVQYRVLELVDGIYQQSKWRKQKGSENFVQIEDVVVPKRKGQPLDFIPFIFVGPSSLSSEVTKPPLLDLVNINLSHYQTMADLEHGRHYVALPTPWVTGLKQQDENEPLEMGPTTVWDLDKGGSAGMLEFSGAGLTQLVTADHDKRRMMAVMGARLLEDQAAVAETATAILMRHSGEGATLRTMTKTVSQALTKCVKVHEWWLGTEKQPSEVEAYVSLNRDFFSLKLNSQEVQAQLQLLQSEAISYETFYHNLSTGGWTRPNISVEDERKQIGLEGGFDTDIEPEMSHEEETEEEQT